MSAARPRVVVVGAGALGSYFAAQLVRAGVDTTLVARGTHAAAIRANGLAIVSPEGRTVVSIPVVESTDDVGHAELVLLCVKSYDLEAAAATLVLAPEAVLVSVQNGVDDLEQVRIAVAPERLLGAVVFEGGARRPAPGVVEKMGNTHLVLGGRAAGSVAPARWASALLDSAGIRATASESPTDFLATQWRKLCRIASISGLSALTRSTAGELVGEPKTRRLLVEAIEEAAAVAAAVGVSISGRAIVEEALDVCQRFPRMKTSMLQDVERGLRLEVDAQSGAIVRAAARAGVDAPLHRFIAAALSIAERGRPT